MRSSLAGSEVRYRVRLDESLCDGCRLCLPLCKQGALIWVRAERELLLDPWACDGCGACVTACPSGALSLHPRGHP